MELLLGSVWKLVVGETFGEGSWLPFKPIWKALPNGVRVLLAEKDRVAMMG